ncbi:MAG TPA: site-specific integrase [Streptosporangiaceae bacterium]|nr:site-specific integrase [Streptosporangiaceae bacterium]
MVALPVLVSGLEAEMIRLGYKDSTLAWYHGAWRRLQRYFTFRGVEEFSLDVAMEWVDEACGGFFAKEQAGTLKQTDVYLFRVAQMLGDWELHGAVVRHYARTVSKLTDAEAAVVARFRAWLRDAGRSVSTVRSYGTAAGEFIAFAGTRGGLEHCDAAMIGAFTATLAGYQAKTVEQKLCALRSFLRFAAGDGLAGTATADAVPAVPSRKQSGIPSVWDAGDVARMLEAVDRGNPCGKRDYAIILLAARLGLRSIDVKRLEFSDFDWPGNRLSVAQAKTGSQVWLPLLKDVGWAVIDYVRNARPASGCPQVFLRHTAPVGPFSDQEHLHQMVVKYARAAHVPVSDKRRRGMHSLRHTLATRLMEDGTPVEQIADILGHQSVTSTGVYLKSSLGLLSKCALDPDEPGRRVPQ